MNWVIFLAVTAGVVLGLIFNWSRLKGAIDNNKRYKDEKDKGNMIRRDSEIWTEEELFFTYRPFDEILNEIKSKDYNNCRVTVEPHVNDNFILFKGPGFNASLDYKGKQEEKYVYSFYFPAYKDRVYEFAGDMNILLTTVEKAFLSLDNGTMTETHKLAYHTRRD